MSIKRKGRPRPIPPGSVPTGSRLCQWPGGRRTFQQKHQNGWNPEPSLGLATGWPCAHLTEPFPPRLRRVSCPEGTERTPRQRGVGCCIGGGGHPQACPHFSYSGAERPLLGVGQSKVSELGLQLSVGWPLLEGSAETGPSRRGAGLPLYPSCAPRWRVEKPRPDTIHSKAVAFV